jgi:hypothetical protein
MTTREVMERTGREIPDYLPDEWLAPMVEGFWRFRSFYSDALEPITPTMISDYMKLTGDFFCPVAVDTLFKMDLAFRNKMAEVRSANEKAKLRKK